MRGFAWRGHLGRVRTARRERLMISGIQNATRRRKVHEILGRLALSSEVIAELTVPKSRRRPETIAAPLAVVNPSLPQHLKDPAMPRVGPRAGRP